MIKIVDVHGTELYLVIKYIVSVEINPNYEGDDGKLETHIYVAMSNGDTHLVDEENKQKVLEALREKL